MNGEIHLHIAGLRYRLRAPPGVRLVDDHELYRDFVGGPPAGVTEEDVVVSVEVTDVRPPPTSAVIFDSGESWLAARDGDGLRLFFRSPNDADRYWWRATVPEADRQIRLEFAPELLESGGALANPLHYPLDQLLTMWLLAVGRGCILHAAGAGHAGRATVFVGRSGAGKTTLMAQLAEQPDLNRLSDDRVAVRLDRAATAFGTPWAGEGLVAGNLAGRLTALVFLHRGDRHHLQPIDARAAAHQLLPTTSIPWFDEARTAACLATLDELIRSVPAYNLYFRPDRGVVEVVECLFEGGKT